MGRLEIRPEEHAALVDGRPLSLTVRELQLLVTLAEHPQRIMTREELFSGSGAAPRAATTARSTSTSAASAPSSAKRSPKPQLIHTHNGIGYRFAPDA